MWPIKSSNGSTQIAKMGNDILIMDTLIHMFVRVLGKTPGFCSSTKFAEVSKPETPSMAEEKPKKIASMKGGCFDQCKFS